MIRVLIAEDSLIVRRHLTNMIGSDRRFTIAGVAEDGAQALEMATRLKPDIIIMDIRMPNVDGAEATKRIMAARPCPIVVISSSVDANETRLGFRALRAGALDILSRPEGLDAAGYEELRRSITGTLALMAEVRVIRRKMPRRHAAIPAPPRFAPQVIGICASIGGPPALESILRQLPSRFQLPILIVQHITPGFGANFVRWLQQTSALPVDVARDGEPLRGGRVYVAPDDSHLLVLAGRIVAVSDALPVHQHRPSGDVLFHSLARVYGDRALGVILTGMGNDGLVGLREIHASGGRVIAQDEASCVIEAMPKSAIEAGIVDEIVPLLKLRRRLVELAITETREEG